MTGRDWRAGRHMIGPYLLVNIACLLWAGNMTIGRAVRHDAGPFVLSAVRIGLAALLFAALLPRTPLRERSVRHDWRLLGGMALTGVAGFPLLSYTALRYTTASNAILIQGAGPLITALLAALFLKRGLTRGQLWGAVLSFAGVALIITQGRFGSLAATDVNKGDLLMVLAVIGWAFYSILARLATRSRSALSASTYATWFAVPIVIPLALGEWQQAPVQVDARMAATFAYVGIAAAFLAFLAWNEGVRVAGPSGAMAFYNMMPVYGALLGAVFLGERPSPAQLAGGVLVVTGGFLAAMWRSRSVPAVQEVSSEA